MKNKVIVFDLDDTLYKEIDFLKSGYMYISKFLSEKYGIGNMYSSMLEMYKQKLNVFAELIEQNNLPLEVSDLVNMYRAHIPNICLAKDTKELLHRFRESCILGIITDGRSQTQWNKFDALGLGDYFLRENVVISEEFGSEKPSVENYLYFQNKFENSMFYYIGDNPRKDFVAPNKLGWQTICLLDNGENIHSQDFSVDSIFLPMHRVKELPSISEFIELS